MNLPEKQHHHVKKWTNIIARPIFNSITIATRIELGPCKKIKKEKRHQYYIKRCMNQNQTNPDTLIPDITPGQIKAGVS